MRLVLRADASHLRGTGHVMRSLAFAQAWMARGGTATFVLAETTDSITRRLELEGIDAVTIDAPPASYKDAYATLGVAKDVGAEWIMVDGYHFQEEYFCTLSHSGLKVVVIDDHNDRRYKCTSILLNYNIYASEIKYTPIRSGVMLLGPKYTPLRREYWRWRGWSRAIEPVARRVLVTFGGSDPHNMTQKALESMLELDFPTSIAVVLGPNYQYEASIQNIVEKLRAQVIRNTTDFPKLISWADIGISASGTTTFELMFMGLPSVILPIAENQVQAARIYKQQSIFEVLEYAGGLSYNELSNRVISLMKSTDQRRAMSLRMRKYVDGLGAFRVIDAMDKWRSV
ncbi:UDP-2,4-diacetamido-2,4,6-trideoxy-beta-L-altropyranose hydrolase [Oceanithermus profundus]|uniref:UDP-2,4-diacetamido-2,4, 6-trideoxy-beta-L-altropyranose hydrolase n=1 Tax=Oceanithermus profundus TaxID=187137 RepID=UPI000A016FE4|nr:UDP-2,4-diacetamido-2,4,6-trideoxy-beta-L-altropyranose hydrolase [Oceanithermus profundus]